MIKKSDWLILVIGSVILVLCVWLVLVPQQHSPSKYGVYVYDVGTYLTNSYVVENGCIEFSALDLFGQVVSYKICNNYQIINY